MVYDKATGAILLSLLLLSSLLLGCVSGTGETDKGTGFLEGRISIGPICPVERNPPDPSCAPTEETYKAYALGVYSLSGEKVAQFNGGKDGNYKVGLAEGKYRVARESGLSRFSAEVEIRKGQTAELDIDIDTGIR